MNLRKTIFLIAIVSVAVTALVGTAAADANVTSSTTYTGSEGGTQAVAVEVTISPDVVTENLTATFQPTDNSFIVYRSFERTQPDGVSISNPSPGKYVIDSLRPGQEVQFQFIAYPKTISQNPLDIATVTTTSEQNPNRQQTTVSANMSASPHFLIQEQQSTIQSLQNQVQTMQIGFYGGIALGVTGLLISGLTFRRMQGMVPKSEVCDNLESLRTRISGDNNKDLVEGELKKYDCDHGEGRITGGVRGTTSGDSIQNETDKSPDKQDGVESSEDDDDIGPVA